MAEIVIQKFLAELGWKLDEEGFRRFAHMTDGSAKKALELGAVFTGAAFAVEQGVERMARNWQDMYYASQKIGDTASNINALNFASSQLNLGDRLVQDVTKYATALRTQPGMQGFFRGLGVNMGREVGEQFLEVIEQLRKMPFPVASQIAQNYLGIDPQTLVLYEQNIDVMRRFQEEQKRIYESYGMTSDKQIALSKDSNQFMQDLGGLGARFKALGSIIAQDFMPYGEKVIHWLDDVLDRLGKSDHKWLDLLAVIGSVAGAGGAGWTVKRMLFGRGAAAAGAAAGGAASGAAATGGSAAGAGMLSWLGPLGAFGGAMLGNPGRAGEGEDEYMASRPDLYPQAARLSKDARIMDFFKKQGLSDAQAKGIADVLFLESGFDPKAVGDHGQAHGLAQWHPDRMKSILKGANIDVSQAGFDDQLKAIMFELRTSEKATMAQLAGTRSEAEAAEVFSAGFERPLGRRYFRDDKGGGVTVTMSPQVTQHIQGHGAHDTAELVLDGQSRINADVLRNIRGILDATGGR